MRVRRFVEKSFDGFDHSFRRAVTLRIIRTACNVLKTVEIGVVVESNGVFTRDLP